MRLIDADATIKYLREFRCKDCDKRKGMKNGKIRFCYEIGDAPCRACDIGDAIDYFLDEAISPTIDAVHVVRCENCVFRDARDGMCEHVQQIRDPDWYCADGERCNRADSRLEDEISFLQEYRSVVDALIDVGYPHNFQREEPWIRDYCYKITGIVKMAYDIMEGKNDADKGTGKR